MVNPQRPAGPGALLTGGLGQFGSAAYGANVIRRLAAQEGALPASCFVPNFAGLDKLSAFRLP